jgi:glycosyltransferase involved in cell wall biosynthesis
LLIEGMAEIRSGHWGGKAVPERLGVLIVAENASMRERGESGLAIHWFVELLKEGIDAHLLAHGRSKPELDQSLSRFASRIHYVPDVLLQKISWNLGKALPPHVSSFTSGWLVHLVTQFMQRRAARRLIEQYKIDVVHEPAPVTPRLPSMMYGLGVPVVIGPMNGNMTYPPGFRSSSFLERAFVPVARRFADLANYLIPGKRQAEVLLVANERTRLALPSGCTGKVWILCENGVEPDVWRRPDDLPARPVDELRLAFLGHLVGWKADMLMDVFAEVKKGTPSAELWIIGDGPERARLQRQVEALSLSGAATFHGWAPPEECARLLSQCDVFLYPSVFDCGGAVVLEAMALGLTVVALNWGGPGDYLASGAGVLVEPVGRRQSVAELAKAVQSLTPSKRRELGEAAQREVADQYTWPAKVRQVLPVYRSVCKSAGTAPGAVSPTEDHVHVDCNQSRSFESALCVAMRSQPC